MSKRLEYIKQGKKVMEEMFIRPDFKLKEFNFDVFIDDMGYLIEQVEQIESHAPEGRNYTNAQYMELLNENERYMKALGTIEDWSVCEDSKQWARKAILNDYQGGGSDE